MTNKSPLLTLNNVVQIPALGPGVFQSPPEQTAAAVASALAHGYRLIDTAAAYSNERQVGEGIRESGISRDDVFVETKLWISDYGYDATLHAFDKSAGKLGVDHLDLLLLHQPLPSRFALTLDAYRALEKLLADGKVRAIGVSNFMPEHLQRLLAETSVVPAVNQIEVHPYFQQTTLQRLHTDHGILTQAWSPIGGITSYRGGEKRTFDDPTLKEIAHQHDKSAAQVMLRWHLQEGRSAIPKSMKPARIAENFDVFDFELSSDQIAAIDALDTGVRGGPEPDSITLETYGREILRGEHAVPLSALTTPMCALCWTVGATREGHVPRSSMAFNIMQEPTSRRTGGQLTPDDTILDLLNHPAFARFGRLLLPWDDRTYDTSLQLGDVSSLLPYHSHVNPATVVSALNHMIDDVNNGHTVFYDFYAENEKREQPTKSNSGLFFFRGRPGAPFAMIAPGGGFSYVGSFHEGFPYALTIASQGYNAFVLKYRAGAGGAVATQDLAAAILYVFHNATRLGVVTEGYSVWGSSAGARMAAAIGSHGVARFGGNDLPKPSAVVMAYTGHSEYSTKEPSAFVVVGERDGIAPPSVMERRVQALRKLGTDVEFHRYRDLGHGFGPGIGTSAEGWLDRAVRFWEKAIELNERRVR